MNKINGEAIRISQMVVLHAGICVINPGYLSFLVLCNEVVTHCQRFILTESSNQCKNIFYL